MNSTAVSPGKVVAIRYTLSLDNGQVVDSSGADGPFEYLHGAGHIVPGLERALEGKSVGENVQVTVAPDEGFGPHRADAVVTVERKVFPADAELVPGQVFQGTDAGNDPILGMIRSVAKDEVVVDLNHPLAGKDLHFAVEIADVRDATDEERKIGGDSAT